MCAVFAGGYRYRNYAEKKPVTQKVSQSERRCRAFSEARKELADEIVKKKSKISTTRENVKRIEFVKLFFFLRRVVKVNKNAS